MKCYHVTTPDRLESIQREGLLPNSPPTWFRVPAPYVLLSLEPWADLNGKETVVLEVTDPRIRAEYFDDPEGLRWPYCIASEYVRVVFK
jgi:hypothetical protein